MALSVDWTSGVITIPKADMSLVQASPFEIRALDVETFHQDLRAIHASTEGAPYTTTHNHTREYTLSGVTYPRAMEILSPYTVEFENGTYGVVAQGGNQNILDVKVANQVSFLGNNSGGPLQGTGSEGQIG
jgi:hypothetical protein